MVMKVCPYCGKDSYSAGIDPWFCPYCGVDITEVEFLQPLVD